MKYRMLGRTCLRCSEVGLGTWAFASRIYGAVPEEKALETIRAAPELGINVFDSAPLYGSWELDGTGGYCTAWFAADDTAARLPD